MSFPSIHQIIHLSRHGHSSIALSLSLRLSVSVSVCLPAYLDANLFVCLPDSLSVCLPASLLAGLFVTVSLSVCLFASVSLYVWLPGCLSIYMSVYLPTCLSMYPVCLSTDRLGCVSANSALFSNLCFSFYLSFVYHYSYIFFSPTVIQSIHLSVWLSVRKSLYQWELERGTLWS